MIRSSNRVFQRAGTVQAGAGGEGALEHKFYKHRGGLQFCGQAGWNRGDYASVPVTILLQRRGLSFL